MRALVVVLTLCGCAASVAATMDEFARGIELVVPADATVFRVPVPDDVYRWTTRKDLGDVRVLNGAGEPVPYLVKRPERNREPSTWQPLPVFALPSGDDPSVSTERIRIAVDDSGTVLAIEPGTEPQGAFRSYLIDAGKLEQAPTELRLVWSGVEEDLVARVRVDGSDDLDDWVTLIDSATLVRLAGERDTMLRDRFELPGVRTRYLRVVQISGSAPLELQAAEVRTRRDAVPKRRWQVLTGVVDDDFVAFDAGGYFPIDQISLSIEGRTSFTLNAPVQVRMDAGADWQPLGTHRFYQAAIDGALIESEPVEVPLGSRYFRVRLRADQAADAVLRVGWLTDEIIAVRQDPLPLTLVYGRHGLEPDPWPLRALLEMAGSEDGVESTAELPLAGTGTPTWLGGRERLQPPPAGRDWYTITLWAVLVLGVMVVGLLAYRLLRSSGSHDTR